MCKLFLIVQCESEESEHRFNISSVQLYALNKSKLKVRHTDIYLILYTPLMTGLNFFTV